MVADRPRATRPPVSQQIRGPDRDSARVLSARTPTGPVGPGLHREPYPARRRLLMPDVDDEFAGGPVGLHAVVGLRHLLQAVVDAVRCPSAARRASRACWYGGTCERAVIPKTSGRRKSSPEATTVSGGCHAALMAHTTTAADYAWIRERDEYETYCVTLVEGLAPEELLRTLGVESGMRITGVDGLIKPSRDAVLEQHREFAGAASLGNWSLMYEPDGFLGVTDEAVLPLSRGRTVVTNHKSIAGECRFCWYHDGAVLLDFDQAYCDDRAGSRPDELLTEMRESGFDLSGGDDVDPGEQFLAAFALAHRITGIRLTPELFASAEFIGGPGPRWPSFSLPGRTEQ